MARIDVNPSELRYFQSKLSDLRNEVQAHRFSLEKETRDINAYWDGEKYRKFLREQEELMLQIQYFEKCCDLYCDFLARKADAADYFLSL